MSKTESWTTNIFKQEVKILVIGCYLENYLEILIFCNYWTLCSSIDSLKVMPALKFAQLVLKPAEQSKLYLSLF